MLPDPEDSEEDATEFTKDAFEGRYRPYTVSVITTGSLVLVLLLWERGIYKDKEELLFGHVSGVNLGRTVMWLLRTLTIIFWAVIDGLVCWGILLPNLRNLREEPSDHYLSTSITCLVFMNVAGVWGADMSSEVFESNDRKRIMDAAAHNFLITMTLIMLLAMDAYFVAVIHIRYREIVAELTLRCTGQDYEAYKTPGSGFSMASKRKQSHWRRCLSSHGVLCLLVFGGAIDLLIILPAQIISAVVGFIYKCLWRWLLYPAILFPIGLVAWTIQGLGKLISAFSNSPRVPEPSLPSGSLTWRWTTKILENYQSHEKRSSPKFKHSAWVLGAATTSFILLIYMGLRVGSETDRLLEEVYIPSRICMTKNPDIQREILRMIGYGGRYLKVDPQSASDELVEITLGKANQYGMIIAMNQNEARKIVDSVVDEMVLSDNHMTRFLGRAGEVFLGSQEAEFIYTCRGKKVNDTSIVPILNLVNSSLTEPGDPAQAFHRTFEGHAVSFLDSFVMNLRWSFPMALAAGILVGFLTLVKMLHEYKKTLLAVNAIYSQQCSSQSGNQFAASEAELHSSRLVRLAMKDRDCLDVFYSMPRSVFFFGVMLSTALLEFVISYFFFSFLVAGIASCAEAFELFHPFLGVMGASVATWVVDMVVVRLFIGSLLTRKNFRVKHPNLWLMYWIVGSIWHLVLGILIAVTRLIVLALSTILELSRLDLNLYPSSFGLERFDLAESAFGSMIMIHNRVLLTEEELSVREVPRFQFKSVAFSIMGAHKLTSTYNTPSTSRENPVYPSRR